MGTFSRRSGLVAGLAMLVAVTTAASPAIAAETEQAHTVMTVGEMCGGCVKKITKRFEGIKGIAGVKCSIEQQSVTVVPEKGVRLSPRGVWDLMASIGKTPTKMVCPAGTFTSRPPQ